MTTNLRTNVAATLTATIRGALGALATISPASANDAPADPGSPGGLSGNVVHQHGRLAGTGQGHLKAGAAADTAGQVTVTALTADEFNDQRRGSSCRSYEGVTYCQWLQSHGYDSSAYVDWTAYISVPQDTVNATMSVSGDSVYTAAVHAQSGYVKVVWNSPSIPSLMTLYTDVEIDLDSGTYYRATCPCSYQSQGGMYDEEELALEP
jgi:hypothetical protein